MMLVTDIEFFEQLFPEASAYLIAAKLRYECYSLVRDHALRGRTTVDGATPRLVELVTLAPACREPWFAEKLRLEYSFEMPSREEEQE